MCIAVNAPAKGRLVTWDEFQMMRENNSDGMGLMWAEDGRLHIVRRMRRTRRMYNLYEGLHKAGKDVVLHFRWATHGARNESNVHPVLVGPDLAFVHNGMFFGFSDKDSRSDTRQFADSVLRRLPKGWHREEKWWEDIEQLTQGSKLIFMDATGFVRIMHKTGGVENGGVWFSNDSFKYPTWSACGYTGSVYSRKGAAAWWERRSSAGGKETGYWGDDDEPAGEIVALTPTVDDVPIFAGAYYHAPSSSIVCEECVRDYFIGENWKNFESLWDDGADIACEGCGKVVNVRYGKDVRKEAAGCLTTD